MTKPQHTRRRILLLGILMTMYPGHAAKAAPFQVYGLDATQTIARQDVFGEGCCNANLSLISDNTQPDSWAWPLTVTLNDTTSPQATQNTSQSVGVNVRSYSSSTGSPWTAGVHSEVWQGWSYPYLNKTAANGTTLAYNAEVHRNGPGGFVAGLNLQSDGPVQADDAINVQGSWGMAFNAPGQNIMAGRYYLAPRVFLFWYGHLYISTNGVITKVGG